MGNHDKIRRNEEKCTLCLLCVRDCIAGVWRMSGKTPVPTHPALCNRCGHCVSVCPTGAVEHDLLDKNQVRQVESTLVSPKGYKEIVLGRRSVRAYSKREVPKAVIDTIIDVARYTPTSSNSQDVGYIVITDRTIIGDISRTMYAFAERIYHLMKKQPLKFMADVTGLSGNRYLSLMDYTVDQTKKGRDFFLHDAPVFILIHGPEKSGFARENCAIASMNIMNYAHSLGLGSCYIGLFIKALGWSRALKKKVPLPSGRKIYSSLVLGYPAYPHRFTVSRKKPPILWMEKRKV